MTIPKFIASFPIHFYRWTFKAFVGHNCRYEPSCSAYTLEAIQKHGAIKGWWLGLKRILRCNPWGSSGYDSVPVAKPRRYFLDIPDYNGAAGTHKIVVYDWGDPHAAHVVICVHGLTRNGRDFDLLAKELARRGLRVVCPTMAGRGESEQLKNPADYNSANCALDCLYILDRLQLREVDWIGTSMGGIIGMNIASAQPGRIRKLVLNDIGMLVKKEALQRIYTSIYETPPRFKTREEADAYLRKACAGFGIADPYLWKLFFDYSFDKLKDGGYCRSYDPKILYPKYGEAGTEIVDIDLSSFWQNIHIPTLILRGEDSDLLDAETVVAMCATNPNATSVTIEGVGHAPALMSNDQISLVCNWLLNSKLAPGRESL